MGRHDIWESSLFFKNIVHGQRRNFRDLYMRMVHAYGSWRMEYGLWLKPVLWSKHGLWFMIVYGLPVPWDYNYHGYYRMFHSILFRGSSRTIFRPRKNKKNNINLCSSGSKPWYLVNPKIAGKWMVIPLKMVLIGIGPYPCSCVSI